MVLRLPLSIAPSSPTRITGDMISPPLSPDFNFDSDALTPSVLPALEYISSKLQQKSMHVTLLVGRGKPFPTGDGADLIVLPITELDPSSWKMLYRIVEKAVRKFALGQSWTDALGQSQSQSQRNRRANEYLVQQSIMQNEILFSQEGLTLLNVDRIYTFKRRLCVLSAAARGQQHPSEERYINSCVHLLHQTIRDCQGRPFSQAFFHRVYEHLGVSDELLVKVAAAYKAKYGQDGIVLPRPEPKQHARRSPGPRVRRRAASPRQQGPPPSRAATPPKRGPKTPLSASDVTPITRNEWNILIGQDFWQNKPTVTMWVPSPAVQVAG
ncbi:hypothetical protein VTN96DRAFT_9524 [Rasamsonia emersonii]|uniref:DUF7582 domain-containing protein n=1 Tax=Rasamsonia emersonii (strain ATCC 16479 / CBS 393.64 / IMI 116815) TaxID=1408163 RepID=A0A0F4YSU9_RASE3|nr:hypothetical protein T310_4813 [Rasamsonia emersonii CBS 393.64]KKA21160.1 hypothetical protein T310_4813 [Rasamsonia emersonii CBS 393.64]